MDNKDFWNSLKANWSTLQIQAKDTRFDSELLKKKMHKQINKAKTIRQTHFSKNDFLKFADSEEDEY